MLHERCGIVLVGDAPRALARTHARLSSYPTVVLGGSLYGVPSAQTLTDALRVLDVERFLIVDASIELDEAAAFALLAHVAERTLTAPAIVDGSGALVRTGSIAIADPARGRALIDADVGGFPRGLDGRCIAADRETLARYAPERNGRAEWLAATRKAAEDGCALAIAAEVRVRNVRWAVPPLGDDPRDSAAESALLAYADPPWIGYASRAAQGAIARRVRVPLGIDVPVRESAPCATVLIVGEPGDRAAIECGIRGGTPLERVDVIAANDVTAAREALRVRGDRYVAFVDASTRLEPGWLDAACDALERDALASVVTSAAAGADARATVVAAARVPSAEQIDAGAGVHASVGNLVARLAKNYRSGVRRLEPPLATLSAPSGAVRDAALATPPKRFSGIASIVMLSWNAPEFTRMAVESIRAVTRYPYEIIVVDNGSDASTREVLEALVREHGIRVVYNDRNLGFGMGMNVGIAAARGDAVVLLNNDVIVGEGWLEALIDGLETRRRAGVTAPRSNRVAGPQVLGVPYTDVAQLAAFVAQRREEYAGEGFWLDRVIGFCMCFDRRVLDEVGGFDPLYGIGNFEDDDLCIRVRAAGWGIFVCDDAFIHHFGSASFVANKIDYRALMETNWRAFTGKWELGDMAFGTPYSARAAYRRGFDRTRDYVPPDARA